MISNKTIQRLSKLYSIIKAYKKNNINIITSDEIARELNTTSDTIRKDFNIAKIYGIRKSGYDVDYLLNNLEKILNLNESINACIIGLGRLGTALLNYKKFEDEGFKISAGFDSNINRIEMLKTNIPLFPITLLKEKIKTLKIKVAIIAVPEESVKEVSKNLFESDIKGILNFSTLPISAKNKNIIVRNIDFTAELRFLAAKIHIGNKQKEE